MIAYYFALGYLVIMGLAFCWAVGVAVRNSKGNKK